MRSRLQFEPQGSSESTLATAQPSAEERPAWLAAIRWYWSVLRGRVWDKDLYCCVQCGHRLRRSYDRLSCRKCGKKYPVVYGVPLLLRGVQRKAAEPLSEASLKAICNAYGIPPENTTIQQLDRILGEIYELSEGPLQAENNYLLQRLAIDRSARPSVDAMAAMQTGTPHFAIVRHYLPSELSCGALTSHNVRIRNTGTQPLKRHSLGGWELRAHWIQSENQEPEAAGKPSPLPVSILPGRELTVPFWLQSPTIRGQYRLTFSLVADGSILHDPGPGVLLRVSETVGRDYPPLEPATGPLQPDYDEDHRAGIRILEQVVRRKGSRLGLEIGGSSCPMTTNLPCRIVNTDVDIQTMQVAKLVLQLRGHANLAFACCDGVELPFGESTFDFAAVFATLHHFADPTAALRSLARVIKADGFIAVMCEPVGHYYDQPDAEMQEVLEHGINEQRFTLDEYARMFHDAGLVPQSSTLDHDSLKVILTQKFCRV